MPTMPLKSLFKRKRRNKSSFRRKELSDEYSPTMEESEHAAQFTAEHDTLLDSKSKFEQSRSRFEAAKRVFNSGPKQQETRETSLTPEKIPRFLPQESLGEESGRDDSNSMHKIFPSDSQDSTEIDIDSAGEQAPKERRRTAKRNDAQDDFDGFWKERSLPHQRVAWTGSVVGFNQNNAGFGQMQSQDDISSQSKSSSFLREDEDTTQYDEIDNRDYLIESDNESTEADGSPSADGKRDQQPSNDFVSFGDSYFRDEGIIQQNAGVFTNPHSTQRGKSHRAKVAVNRPPREEVQAISGKQQENTHSASLASTPSIDSYLLRGTESDSILLGEHLAPSASEDFFAEETNLSEQMSTNNSLIDNSVIEEAGSRQPDGRTDYSPSHFQNDFVKTVRHGWNYLEHTMADDQNGLPIQPGDITKTVREGWSYLEHNLADDQNGLPIQPGDITKTVREGWSYLEHNLKSIDTEFHQDGKPRVAGELAKTVREGWNYLEHSLDQGVSAKPGEPELDAMMTTLRQSWSHMTDDTASRDVKNMPSNTLVGVEALANRQEEFLSTVVSNMSFFNDDSTAEDLEPKIFGAPMENTNSTNEVAPKDPDEILDEVLENWSLTSDTPTGPNEQNSSDLANEETIAEPKSTNENGLIATVRQTLNYLKNDDDNKEKKIEESNEVQESPKENGLMSTLRQTWSYVSEDGDNDEEDNGLMSTMRHTWSYVSENGDNNDEDNEPSMMGSNSVDGKTRRTKKREEKRSGISQSWSLVSAFSRNDDDSGTASDASSIETESDDESAIYADESADFSDVPSDEGDDFSAGGHVSIGEGGMLDQVLDHWVQFAKVAGIPEDFDGYTTVSSDGSAAVDARVTRRGKKSSSKNRRGGKRSKNRNRKKKSSKSRRLSIPKNVFGTGNDDSEASVSEDKYPSTGIVVDIPLHPMVTHTTEQVAGHCTTDKTNEGDVVAHGSQDSEKAIVEDQVTPDPQDEEPKTQPFDEVSSTDETLEAKNEEESVSEEIVNVDSIANIDSIAEVTQTAANDDNEGYETAKEEETQTSEEEIGTDGVTGPVLLESAELEGMEENGKMRTDAVLLESAELEGIEENVEENEKMRTDGESIASLGGASEGEYGKMSAEEESIESLGCATATENVSVQSIQDADDHQSEVFASASEVFDADDISEDGKESVDVSKENSDGESADSGTVSESSEESDDGSSYYSGSDNCSEYDSEYTDEYSDESSSTGPIKRSYSASSMKSAALERFGQPDSETDINTADKVKSTKGRSGRVVDCQRSSKRSHRSRKKRTEEESEASRPHRRRLV